ncbi:MAG: hypothetical protein IJU72_05600, partial [Bacteroidales bacterium]|nr:hypothetical protein [Bacteroidales bacterium]
VYRLTSLKYLIYSMNLLNPATAASCACVGTRRMEAGQPSALGMRTCEGKGAEQWQMAMDYAKEKHPKDKFSA